MVKQFILLLQLIGVFIYQIVLFGDVTVSQVVPSSIPSNSEATVEITVAKGNISGFAKVQQDVPAGFTIEPIETKGATFSFKDNRIKFIWMALPAEEEFTISYKIKPLEGTTGNYSLSGKFSFIADSERQNIPIAESKFKVTEELLTEETSSSAQVEPESVESETEDNTSEELVAEEVTETSEEIGETDVVEETSTETERVLPIEINSKRTIVDNGDGSFNVKVSISKKGVEGFAKVSEIIPDGFTAEEINPNGGVFSFKEKQAKILWMAIPKSDEVEIEYLIKSETAQNGGYSISGSFAYLENDVTQDHKIEASSFMLNVEEVIAETIEENTAEVEEEENTTEVEEEEITAEVSENNPEETETTIQEKVEEEVDKNTSAKNTENLTSIPNPETGVSYKVQVGAGHQTIPSNWFAQKFNLNDDINTENHEGWIKYVVGSFNEYKSARDKRNVVRNKVKRAFVTAYNSGKRITVQEALMISNQKWYN